MSDDIFNIQRSELLCTANLRGITGITELSWSNAKVNNLWVCNDIGITLAAVKLINA